MSLANIKRSNLLANLRNISSISSMETTSLSLQMLYTMLAHQCSAEAVLPSRNGDSNMSRSSLCIGHRPFCFTNGTFDSNDEGNLYLRVYLSQLTADIQWHLGATAYTITNDCATVRRIRQIGTEGT